LNANERTRQGVLPGRQQQALFRIRRNQVGRHSTVSVSTFGLHLRTVQRWVRAAGTHCQTVPAHLVEQPRALGQVHADEWRIKTQAGIVWITMAVYVAMRLWLDGVVITHRDRALPPPPGFQAAGSTAHASAIACCRSSLAPVAHAAAHAGGSMPAWAAATAGS